jgi:hypothetical protein
MQGRHTARMALFWASACRLAARLPEMRDCSTEKKTKRVTIMIKAVTIVGSRNAMSDRINTRSVTIGCNNRLFQSKHHPKTGHAPIDTGKIQTGRRFSEQSASGKGRSATPNEQRSGLQRIPYQRSAVASWRRQCGPSRRLRPAAESLNHTLVLMQQSKER